MDREITNLEKMQRLKFALVGDACNSIYLNLATAGSVLLLFMDRIGLGTAQMGVLLALLGFGPMIAPVTAQLGVRWGLKRLWLAFSVLRVVLLAGMIAAPWIAAKYGPAAAFGYVAAVLVCFSLSRSVVDSMGGPWSAEFVPTAIRGRFTGQQTILTMLCGAGAILAIGYYLGEEAPVRHFQLFFAIAIFFGLIPAWCYAQVPGGEPQPEARVRIGDILMPLRDRVFRRHLLGHTFINLGWFVGMTFTPLYLRDQIGLPPDQVVTLDAISMLGSLTSSFAWGWAADRYGGKPLMVLFLTLHVLMPMGLLLMPRHDPWSHGYAVVLYYVHGFVGIGWVIGFYRYFFANLLPQENRAPYTALNACVAGLTVGSGPLLAGLLLEKLSWVHGQVGPVAIDRYTPFFIGLIVCALIAAWLMSGLPSAGAMDTRKFATMFVHGDPWATATGLVEFRYAGTEGKRVAVVEKLGTSASPFAVNELIEAMEDPSFSVRYEAIVSSVRTVRDPRLTGALLQLLKGADPGLQMAAVWALGRIGDDCARDALRRLLESPYKLMRAQAGRSLGMLGDTESAAQLLAMFRIEVDVPVRVAYGAALGLLGRSDATADLLELLRELVPDADEHFRREVALAVATLIGNQENAALRLWRQMHTDPGNTLAAVLLALRQRLSQPSVCHFEAATMQDLVERCAYAFAADDFEGGVSELVTVVDAVKPEAFTPVAQSVLVESRRGLAQHGTSRREYILLAIHGLHMGLREGA